MEILAPSTYVFDCKCHCGARFIATNGDFLKLSLRFIDQYWNATSISGDNTNYQDMTAIVCPFCNAFKIIDSWVSDNPKKYKEVLDNDPEKIFIDENELQLYFDKDKEMSKMLSVEVKRWDEIPILRERYKFGLSLEALND